MAGLLIVIGTLLTMRERARSFGDHSPERVAPVPADKPTPTWQDHVAERLRTVNETSRPPPVIVSSESRRAEQSTADRLNGRLIESPLVLTIELLRELEWKRFELIVQRYYGATGVRAELTCAGADGGVDVKLFRPGSDRAYCYVQCKAWGAEKVKLRDVREFLGVMAADRIEQGVFVTTSDFWPDARSFAQSNGIAALTASDFVARFAALPVSDRGRILAEVTKGDYTTPSCPACEARAVSRERKRDGVKFWACRCGWRMTARGEGMANGTGDT